jgi:peptide deformylase
MAKLVSENHPALHQIAEEVPAQDIASPKIRKVLNDMRAALVGYNAEGFIGVAIAAPQIGVPLRMFLVHDMSTDRDEKLPDIVAINPILVKVSKKSVVVGEGCLSVPERYGAVRRARQATLRAYDEAGKEYERGATGLLAQIFQHECDHLDGILFVDRAEKVWTKEEMDAHNEREAEYAE